MSRPTIRDVAARAGVSKSLVSLVLRDAPHVSDEKRRAVREAIAELGYRPNAVARSLVRKRTGVIGVVISDHHNPFFADVIDGIEERAARAGYTALHSSGGRSAAKEAAAVEKLLDLRADGIILAGSHLATGLIAAASRTVPVVLLTRTSRTDSLDTVVTDDEAGARLAVDHLVGLGHRRIGHVEAGRAPGGPARRRGYERAMRAHGLERHVRVARGAFTEEGGAAGTAELLKGRHSPTAIFACNDLAALGALSELEARGRDVPGDVSLVGFDNSSLASLGLAGLTTIDQPRSDIGAQGVELLLERIDGRQGPRRVVVAPSLVVRSTTAPPA